MASRTSLLKTLLIAVATAPSVACGDSSDGSSTDSTASSGGAGQGGNAAGSGGAAAGSGGAAAGSGGAASGAGGAAAGTGGSPAGAGGEVGAGAGGSPAGAGGSPAGAGGEAGAAAGAGGEGGHNGGSGGSAGKDPCPGAQPILVGTTATGYQACSNGSIHRREVLECPSLLPRAEACAQADQGGNCKSDSDCKDAPNGFCVGSQGGFQAPGCYCAYGCTKDADCGAGSVCLCGDPVGHCVASTCTSDKDCNGGGCTSYGVDQICQTFGFACQNPADTCGGNNDCTSPELCLPEGDHRICKNDQPCAIGRPLLVDELWRFARLTARGDWAA